MNKNFITKWNPKGGGMRKHRISGVAHNHAHSVSRVREYNKEQERLNELRNKRKGKTYSSVSEVFKKKK